MKNVLNTGIASIDSLLAGNIKELKFTEHKKYSKNRGFSRTSSCNARKQILRFKWIRIFFEK